MNQPIHDFCRSKRDYMSFTMPFRDGKSMMHLLEMLYVKVHIRILHSKAKAFRLKFFTKGKNK